MLRALLQTRGGDRTVADLPYSALGFSRRANDTTDATVTVPYVGLSDRSVLADPEPWELEVAIWDEDDAEPLWVGPFVTPTWSRTAVDLGAKDLFAWFDHRRLPADRTYTDTDLGVIFAGHVADALRDDPSPNITLTPTSVGFTGTRTVAASQRLYAGDQLRELSRSGVDFTMAGRGLLLSSSRIPGGSLPPLIDGVLDDPRLTSPGLSAATEVTVLGAVLPDGTQIAATASTPDGVPLLQTVRNEPGILDHTSAQGAAGEMLAELGRAPQVLTGTLDLGWAPLRDLVPGRVAVASGMIGPHEVTGRWRLVAVSVAVDAATRVDVTFTSA